MKVYLIRHSMTEGNKEKRYIGTTDEPLCEEGVELLKKRLGKYPEVGQVYVSPMKRCIQTAEMIYPERTSKRKWICNEKLRECDFGSFENKNYQELSGEPEYQAWIDSGGTLPFPDGESRAQFVERTLEGFREVIQDASRKGWPEIAIIAHGGTIMSIMKHYACGRDGNPAGGYYDFQVKNGEGYELRITESDLYDGSTSGRLSAGSVIGRSQMAIPSGTSDRTSDILDRTNYKKMFAKE